MAGGMMNKVPIAKFLPRATLTITAALALSASNMAPKAEPPLKGAAIGGPFTLTNQRGETVKDSDFAGQYRLIYFGYSFCPDVCPVDLQKLMQGLARFEKMDAGRGARIAPIFITVDPARDTPESLAPFVARYHPRLLGLTGSDAAIAAAAKAFVVSYQKQEGSAPDKYLMGHTQNAYLMGPKGEPLALLPLDNPATQLDEGSPDLVAAELDRWTE
jgi:protein SCO1